MSCVTAEIDLNNLCYKSIDKVQQYPLVNDSLLFVLGYYQWLKSTNAIIDSTLTKAEKTLTSVKNTAEPIAFNKLKFLDNIVFNQLEKLERSCPIILESSKTIVDISSKVYQDNIQPAVKTIFWPVKKTINTVSWTSNFALTTVSSVVETSMDKILPANFLIGNPTHFVIDKTDRILDKFLPECDDECSDEELNDANIYSKLSRLSTKTQNRIYKKALKQIDLLQKSSLAKLEYIQCIIGEIQNKKHEFKENLIQEYFQTLDSIKSNIPLIPLEHWKLMKEILHNSKELLKSLSISSTLTIEFMVKNALDASIILNDNLLNLQNMLIKANPEFVSDSTLAYSKSVITLIRAWLDFFINLFKIINLIGVKPLLAIV